MQNNYYLLKQLSDQLKRKILGWKLMSCFSQNKDELVLEFGKGNDRFYINAVLPQDLTCLVFPSQYHRARKNSINLFSEALGFTVNDIRQYLNERCFSLQIGEYMILFKMFGNRSNLILYHGDQFLTMFKKNLKNDRDIQHDALDRQLNQTFQEFLQQDCDYKPLFPTFGKVVEHHLRNHNYGSLNPQKRWALLELVRENLENPHFFGVYIDQKPAFSLIDFENSVELGDHPIEALNEFYYSISRNFQLEKEKQKVVSRINRMLKRNHSYLEKSELKLKEIELRPQNNQIADIIMANLSNIPNRAEKVELLNFYEDQSIIIKLNKKLSPQKNAETYYRKSKNHQIEVQNLKNNLSKKQTETKALQKYVKAISEIKQLKDLNNFLKANNLVSSTDVKKILPFKEFTIQGFSVWVGKNARDNDRLLKEFAWKEDLWLHARGVSGSHVIIKHQAGKNYPMPVKQKAAQIAAWFSKGKTDSFCPVIYTARKFVRKPKGSEPGVVKVEKEQVLLVEPALPV